MELGGCLTCKNRIYILRDGYINDILKCKILCIILIDDYVIFDHIPACRILTEKAIQRERSIVQILGGLPFQLEAKIFHQMALRGNVKILNAIRQISMVRTFNS